MQEEVLAAEGVVIPTEPHSSYVRWLRGVVLCFVPHSYDPSLSSV